jgi:hypothetical protein
MTVEDSAHTWWSRSRRLPVDDAYTAWFNAHSRCTQALRAWNAAPRRTRAAAYHAYVGALQAEEAAAQRLQQLHLRHAAA